MTDQFLFLFFGTGQSRKLDMHKEKRVPVASTKQKRIRGHVEDIPIPMDGHPVEEQPDAPLTSPVEGHHIEEQADAPLTSPVEGNPSESQSNFVHSSVGCK
jgi:hypothetical protein